MTDGKQRQHRPLVFIFFSSSYSNFQDTFLIFKAFSAVVTSKSLLIYILLFNCECRQSEGSHHRCLNAHKQQRGKRSVAGNVDLIRKFLLSHKKDYDKVKPTHIHSFFLSIYSKGGKNEAEG